MDTEKPIIAILGASGTQGSGIINAILSHPVLSTKFTIRALSRNPSALATKYPPSPTTPITTSFADNNSLPSLITAFSSAHTVFGITNYYETRSLESDVQQGKNIVDACVAAGVKHLIWSTMRSTRDVSDGAIALGPPGMNGKAFISQYIEMRKRQAGAMLRATHLLVASYYSNLSKVFGYENEEGVFELKMSVDRDEVRLPLVDAQVDVGRFVVGVMLKGPEAMDGKFVQVVSEWCTMGEICEGWKALCAGREGMRGKEMRYETVSDEVFEQRLAQPLQVEGLGGLSKIWKEYQLFGKGSLERQKADDEVIESAGLKKSSWVEYLKRDFDQDFANPMFPPFMVPYLAHRMQPSGVNEVQK